MKRLLVLVLVSVSLSIAATLLAAWVSMTFRTAPEEGPEAASEEQAA